MNTGRSLLSQILTYIPKYQLDKIIEKHKGNYKAQEFSCWEQYVCMVFAQLTYRESLRDIESCLEAFGSKLYHCGIQSKVAKSTLAYWNGKTNWHIYCEYAQYLIGYARKLYKGDNEFIVELDATVYAFDSTTIDLCLTLFPWAKFRRKKGAIKAHTLIDLDGNIPAWIFITEGSVHDVNALDHLPIEAGAYYVMDKGYVDFKRLYRMNLESATWITRAKDNMKFKRLYSAATDRSSSCDTRSQEISRVALFLGMKVIRFSLVRSIGPSAPSLMSLVVPPMYFAWPFFTAKAGVASAARRAKRAPAEMSRVFMGCLLTGWYPTLLYGGSVLLGLGPVEGGQVGGEEGLVFGLRSLELRLEFVEQGERRVGGTEVRAAGDIPGPRPDFAV